MGNASDDPADIRNWQRRSDQLTTSGKLEAGDPARLAAIGVRHVINLALGDHPEALQNEAALLAEQDIAYTHIPVPFDAPTAEHTAELRKVIHSIPGPTHVHCIMNYRVTAFLYLLDLEAGMPMKEARAAMQEVWDPIASDEPLATPWRDFILGTGDS